MANFMSYWRICLSSFVWLLKISFHLYFEPTTLNFVQFLCHTDWRLGLVWVYPPLHIYTDIQSFALGSFRQHLLDIIIMTSWIMMGRHHPCVLRSPRLFNEKWLAQRAKLLILNVQLTIIFSILLKTALHTFSVAIAWISLTIIKHMVVLIRKIIACNTLSDWSELVHWGLYRLHWSVLILDIIYLYFGTDGNLVGA